MTGLDRLNHSLRNSEACVSGIASVITLHKGRPDHLRKLIEGLDRCGYHDELVIAEMGEMTSLPVTRFSVSQIQVAGHRLPLAKARNAGRRATRAERLIFLDVDCIPAQAMVAVLASLLDRHDALICANVRYLETPVEEDWTEVALIQNSQEHPARPFPSTGFVEAGNPGLFWSLAFAIRTNTFDRIGGFDETFEGYGAEDTDFSFRARAAGVPLLMCADAVAFHQPHEALDPPLQHFADIMRNAAVFRGRHGFWPMQGWLDAFAKLGLIAPLGDGWRIVRSPTSADFAVVRARQT